MNKYPLWKNLLVVGIIVIGVLFALPNLYDDDFAVQVSSKGYGKVDLKLMTEIETALNANKIEYKQIQLNSNILLIHFADADIQLKAKYLINNMINGNYIIALNLAQTTPKWLAAIGAKPMHLGLDLRGGVHFLIEVNMDAVIKKLLNNHSRELKELLRSERIRYKQIQVIDTSLQVSFRSMEYLKKALAIARSEFSHGLVKVLENKINLTMLLTLTDRSLHETQSLALQQNITTLRNRINELGVAEPTVQQQGDHRIVVQLPGVQDTTQAKKILGATAALEFRLVDNKNNVENMLNRHMPVNTKLLYHRDGQPFLLNNSVMLTGEHIINAVSTLDGQTGSPSVSITLDSKGAEVFSKITRDNIGNPMAVVFIESKTETRKINGEIVKVHNQLSEIISVATIRDQLSKKFQITGLNSTNEAYELALLLRAGALAAPIEIIEERTVGPSLGRDNIDQGFKSVMIGFVLVLILMVISYKTFGAVANLALAANLVLIVALLSMLQATLTMPGIAGIVLIVGIAIDANILIFERIREEILIGNSLQISINAGYRKAFSTIMDANITTLIAAIVLFSFGTGSIKGFAVTLSLGILTSMFTAIMGTRAVINLIYDQKYRSKISI